MFFKKAYHDFKSAIQQTDGLAVMALFFDITEVDNPSYSEFTNLLEKVRKSNSSVDFNKQTSLRNFLASDLDTYYTYDGSLTTPPCLEVVKWIDIEEPVLLSHNQVN